MTLENSQIRTLILYHFKKGSKQQEAADDINNVFGEHLTTQKTVSIWYKRFTEGDISVEDVHRSGRPREISDDDISELIIKHPSISTENIAEELNVTPRAVRYSLTRLGYKSKYQKWVPHQLSPDNMKNRIAVCEKLLKRYEKMSFLEQIVTVDEKWVYYKNQSRHRQCLPGQSCGTVARTGLTKSKILLTVFWDCRGVIMYHFLKSGETMNSDVYCDLLDSLNVRLHRERPAVVNRKRLIFHQDNAKPHTSKKTKAKLKQLQWEVLDHPPYSPDIAPTDFHLFRALQNYLDGTELNGSDDCQNEVLSFLLGKPQEFFKSGICKLPKRWSEIIAKKGDYLDD